MHVFAKPGFARRSRTQRFIFLGASFVLLVLLIVFGGPAVLAAVAKAYVAEKISEVSRLLGRELKVAAVSSDIGRGLVLENISMLAQNNRYEVLGAQRIEIAFSIWDALLGRKALSAIEVSGLRANIVLDGRVPEEVVDIFKRAREASPHRGKKSGSVCGIPELTFDGEIRFLAGGSDEILGAIDVTSATIGCEEGEIGLRLQGITRNLGPGQARVFAVARGRSLEDFSLEVRSSAPIEPTTLFVGTSGFAIQGRGFFVATANGETTIRVEDLQVSEVIPLGERFWLSHAGPLSASEVRLIFSRSVQALMRNGERGLLDAVKSATMRGGSGHIVPTSHFPAIRFRGLNASLSRDPSGAMTIRVEGEASAGHLGYSRIDLTFGFGAEGRLDEIRAALAGPVLVEMIANVHKRLLAWPGSSANLTMFGRRQGERWGFGGQLSARGIAYFWTKLCLVPISGLAFDAALQGEIDLDSHFFSLKIDPMSIGEARFVMEVKGFDLDKKPRFEAFFSIPRQDCNTVFKAIPRVMVPRLDGAQFEGTIALEARFIADLSRPERSSLSVTPDVEGCNAITLGPLIDVERLNSDKFVLEIREKDLKEPIKVGPGTPSYVPISEIPTVVQQAALATEDMAFFRHQGFRIGLINRAIKLNLSEGWYVYGGSTISQQLVKNLFLSREKTLARKLEEAIIVWEMEKKVEKERILELYLNCIEFGLHVYGIRAAAQTYFGKEVRDLTASEAAFIMATKPAPKYAYKVYESRCFNEWWVKRIKGILERLWREMDVIDEVAARTPDPCPPGGPRGKYLVPCFYYPEEGVYMQPKVAPGTEVPPGMPENLPGAEGGGQQAGQ